MASQMLVVIFLPGQCLGTLVILFACAADFDVVAALTEYVVNLSQLGGSLV